jgi:O-antigen/teichoic acid export membrane protein
LTPVPENREAEAPKPGTSLLAGASWLAVSKTVSFAITILLPFILIRRLTQTEYGYYKQLFLILQSAGNLLPLGMHMSLFYFIPRAATREEKGNIVLGAILFYLCTTTLVGSCLILNPGLLSQLLHSQPLTQLNTQIALTLVPYLLAALLDFVLIANGDTKLSAIAVVFINLLRTVMILGAAVIWGSIGAILWAMSILTTLQTIWLFSYVVRNFGHFWKTFRWRSLLTQMSYALPVGLAGDLYALQIDLDNYFVSHYFNAAMFAIYTTGCFDVPLIGILGDSVGTVLIPRVSSLQAKNLIPEIVELTAKAIRGLAFVYVPVYAFLSIAATQLITMLFRADYLASVPIFRINLLMVMLGVVAIDPVMRAFKSERFWMLKMNVALLVLLVIALSVGMKTFGLLGAVSSVVFIQYLARALMVWRVSRLLDVQWTDIGRLKDVGKIALAALAAGLSILPLLLPVQRWGELAARSHGGPFWGALAYFWGAFVSLVAGGSVFAAVYLVALLVLKVPTQSEISWCRSWAGEALRLRFNPVARTP